MSSGVANKILLEAADWLVAAAKVAESEDGELPVPTDDAMNGILCGLIFACKCRCAELLAVLQSVAAHWVTFPNHCLVINGVQQAADPNQETTTSNSKGD